MKIMELPTEQLNKVILKIVLKVLKILYLNQYNTYKIQEKKKE